MAVDVAEAQELLRVAAACTRPKCEKEFRRCVEKAPKRGCMEVEARLLEVLATAESMQKKIGEQQKTIDEQQKALAEQGERIGMCEATMATHHTAVEDQQRALKAFEGIVGDLSCSADGTCDSCRHG